MGDLLLADSVFIIRDAAFGQDFGPKAIAALLGIVLVVWDCRTQRRWDYAWVFGIGTVIWMAAELFLQLSGVRDMPSHQLFGRELGPVAAQLIQGASEGALVAVMGLFVGDRWLVKSRRSRSYLIFVLFAAALFFSAFRAARKAQGLDVVASRRDVLDPLALMFIAIMIAIAVVFWWRYRAWHPRTAAMFVAMVALAAVWTIGQVWVGGRWVEVGNEAAQQFTRAGPLVTFLTLAFDVVVEIALIYVPFLGIPVMLRLIRNPEPLPEVESSTAPEAAVSVEAR